MDLRRLRPSEWVTGALGAALVGSLFLDWYSHAEISVIDGGDAAGVGSAVDGLSAWEAFAVTDLVLALAGGLAIAIWLLTALAPTPALPIAFSTLAAAVVLAAAVWLSVRVLSLPGDAIGREVGTSVGPVLAWMTTLAVWSSVRNERAVRGIRREPRVETLEPPSPDPA